jgi:hypothetical protein
MTNAPKFRAFLPLAGVAVALTFAGQARAGALADWFGWGTPTTVTAGYAPGYGYYYVPTTAYRTLYSPVAVTSYRPVSACGACGAPAITSYMPVTTYVQRPILQAYTAYQPAYPLAPAPACGSCGCATGGCATCGFAPSACPTCGGGCASGACGAALAPAGAPVYSNAAGSPPTLSYMTPSSSTPYAPAQMYASPNPLYPATTTLAMPPLPSAPSVYSSSAQPSTPMLAPPLPGPTSADIAPSLSGPIPSASPTQPTSAPSGQSSLAPQATQTESPKTIEQPASPNTAPSSAPSSVPMKPIPDNRNPATPNSSGSRTQIDPNSRTASSMPMLRPGSYVSTPWPIAKTTAALMPVEPDNADVWHAAR